ncbi:MAG TPA: hypothetical protein EYO94_10470, partial [Acidobacteria bacterium]|nr:hypothetical protein [Acidobacteriota bacterium]
MSLIVMFYRKKYCRDISVALFAFMLVVPLSVIAQPADSVVLAPFVNVSQQSSDDWIGPGILETVSNALQQRGLTVTVVGASLTTDESALTASRAVSADWLVRGTYQRVGDAIRIT